MSKTEPKPDSLEALITVAPESTVTVFDLLAEGGESVKTIEVKRRTLQPEPPSEKELARARARNHQFHSAKEFAEYISREAEDEEKAVVLGDVDSKIVVCVLDEGDVTDRETISFIAKQHPLFDEWEKLLKAEEHDVLDFAKFCQKNRRTIMKPDGRELALLFSQVTMAKTVTVNRGVGKKALNGFMVQTEIGGKKQDEVVELPDSITIKCPLFIGCEPIEIDIDLLVDGSGESVSVIATAPDLMAKRIEAFEQLIAIIREQSGLLVGLGKIAHREWELVR
jgi:hypothetical protein